MKMLKREEHPVDGIGQVNPRCFLTLDGFRIHIDAEPPKKYKILPLDEYAKGIGTNPGYLMSILNAPSKVIAGMDAGEFYNAVKRARIFSCDECCIEVKDGHVSIYAWGDDGQTETLIHPLEVVQDYFYVKINTKYLLDAVNHCGKKGKLYLCAKDLKRLCGFPEVPTIADEKYQRSAIVMPRLN